MATFVQVTRLEGAEQIQIWLNLDHVAYLNVFQPDPPITYVELAYEGAAVGFASAEARYSPRVLHLRESPEEIFMRAGLDI